MKTGLLVLLVNAAAVAFSPCSQAKDDKNDTAYPVQAQFDACEGQAFQAECEYYEQHRRQTVLVVGTCQVATVQAGTRPMERLYCEPYP